MICKQPLFLTNHAETFDIMVNVAGGGESGQAGATRHGITRALIDYDAQLKPTLSKAGLVTRENGAVSVGRRRDEESFAHRVFGGQTCRFRGENFVLTWGITAATLPPSCHATTGNSPGHPSTAGWNRRLSMPV
jgi:hypothetical protein